MDKKQELSSLKSRARDAKRKGHYGRAANLRAQVNELEPLKAPKKKAAAKKTVAKKAPAKKAPAKKAAAKK